MSKKSTSTPNSLSSILSSLTRAAYGESASKAKVNDDELDQYVVDILMKEAKERSTKLGSNSHGYTRGEDESSAKKSKPNIRFLSSMINNVASHNTHLLKLEAQASKNREKEEIIAARDWRSRDNGGRTSAGMRGWEEDEIVPRKDDDYRQERSQREGNDSESSRRRSRRDRDSSRDESHRDSSSRSKSSSSSRPSSSRREERYHLDSRSRSDASRRRRRDDGDEERSSARRNRESPSESRHERKARAQRNARARSQSDGEEEGQSRSSSRREKRNRSDREGLSGDDVISDKKESKSSNSLKTPVQIRPPAPPLPISLPPPPPLLPPPPLRPPPSKMDKYFSPTYDPLLDIAIATDGDVLIPEASIDSWSNMLSVLQSRKEEKKLKDISDKRERKEARERIREERRIKKESKVVGGGMIYDGEKEEVKTQGGLLSVVGYAQKGGVREWDRGK